MKDTNSKVVLVTGCAKGGIGYEYCKAFAERNCHVFASDLPQCLNDIIGLPPDRVETLALDVTCEESVSSAVSTIMSKFGRIDILVNNAGVGSAGPLAELPLDAIRKTWEINTLGQLRLVQKIVPHMISKRCGTIVNVGSVVGKVPTPWAGSYCSSKAYVHAMSHTLRVELRPFNVNVVLVVPGSIRSNIGKASLEGLEGLSDRWKVYGEFKEAIEERARASQGNKATEARVLAKHVVKRVLRDKPPKEIVFGHMSGLFAWLSWSPIWVRDWFFSNRFKLNKKV